MTGSRRTIGFAVLVLAAALAAHVFAIQNGFVDFDDDDYVVANTHVMSGLTWEGVRWAFTTGHAANYHPITWLSHMLDVTLFGLNPAGHHAVNVALHATNACLLFGVLVRCTRRTHESLLVALLFAVHPLHVESVAWISERKDLLCACFMLLALLAYARYARDRNRSAYLWTNVAFVLALLCKPMAVTFPFLALLLDHWPLARTADPALGGTFPMRCRALIREKLPLFALTLFACAVTYMVQRRGGAMNPLYHLSFIERIENASLAYVLYLWKLVWPFNLSPIYPMPVTRQPLWQPAAAALLLLAITVQAWLLRRNMPYLLTGWLWYAGMLVPAIGIVQVGYASMADRYMYLPMAGILIASVWTGSGMVKPHISQRTASTVAALGFVLVAWLASVSQRQTLIWHDSESLFKHAIAVTHENAEAYGHLGVSYLRQNKPEDAIPPLEEAVRIRPALKEARTSLGVAYRMTGQFEQAIDQYNESLRIDPDQPAVYTNLGVAYSATGNLAEAEQSAREALRLDAAMAEAHELLANILEARGDAAEAAAERERAARLRQ